MSTSEDELFEADLQDMELEQLIAGTDRFTLAILNSLYTPEQIKKMNDAGKARGVAFEACHRYMLAMRVMAERFTELQSIKASLDSLL